MFNSRRKHEHREADFRLPSVGYKLYSTVALVLPISVVVSGVV